MGVSDSGSFLTIFTSGSDHWFVFHNFISGIYLSDLGFFIKTKNNGNHNEKPSVLFCSVERNGGSTRGLARQNLAHYHEAASNTEGACNTLMSLIRDDDKRVFMYCELRYEARVQDGIAFLQEMRGCEKRSLDFYVNTEEKAIAARRMQRDKEMEERGGSSQEKYKRMKWVPPPDCRRF
jgi:hypothetical protein